jgi:integrase
LPGFSARLSSRHLVFYVRYWLHGRGRLVRYRIGAAPKLSLAEARAEARRILARVELAQDPHAEREQRRQGEDLVAVCQAYLEAVTRRGIAVSTRREFGRQIRAYVAPARIAHVPALDLRRRDVRAWLDKLAEEHGGPQANRVYQLVRAACRWAVRDELLTTDPLHALQRPRPEAPRERVLTDDEVDLLWTVIDGEARSAHPDWPARAGAAAQILLLLGQRCGETLAMRWEHLDLDASPALWRIPGESRKGGRAQVVPLPPLAVRILDGLRPAGAPEPLRGRVFDRLAAGRQNALRWWAPIRTKAMAAGAEHFTRHDLRRTCATGCARLGAAPEVVSRILGHSVHPGGARVTATYDRYDRLGEQAAALVTWAAHVERIASGERRRGEVLPFGR